MPHVLINGAPLVVLGLCLPSASASTQSDPLPARYSQVDENGVDLVSGGYNEDLIDISFGGDNQSGATRLKLSIRGGSLFAGTFNRVVYLPSSNQTVVQVDDSSIYFKNVGGGFQEADPQGGSLEYNSNSAQYLYINAMGEKYYFSSYGSWFVLSKIIFPNGNISNYSWTTVSGYPRISQIQDSYGYRLSVSGSSTIIFALSNLATGGSVSAALTSNTLTYPSGAVTTVEGPYSSWEWGRVTEIRYPGTSLGAGPDVLLDYVSSTGPTGSVGAITKNGVTTNYSYIDNFGIVQSVGVNSAGKGIRYVSAPYETGLIIEDSVSYGPSQSASQNLVYNALTNKLEKITYSSGSSKLFEYDARGNLQKTTYNPIPGSGLSSFSTSSLFPSTCTNRLTCNKPTSVTDGRGNTTDFTYDPIHGGVLTETGPAVGGVRPQKRFSYVQRYAWISNWSGGYVQGASPIWLLSEERFCKSSATVGGTCAGGVGDEVVTSYDYGSNSGPNNLLLRKATKTADGVSLVTCFAYDAVGNKISETSPRADLTVCP